MRAVVSPVQNAIALQLDVAIVLEALILKRLRSLPSNSKQMWLRGLLVQGFQNECRTARDLQHAGPGDTNASGQQTIPTQQAALEHQVSRPQQETHLHTQSVAISEQSAGNIVSFAALRKVIG